MFDEILFETCRKLDISGVYPPLSYPLRGPYGTVDVLAQLAPLAWAVEDGSCLAPRPTSLVELECQAAAGESPHYSANKVGWG